jgi:hypothetical protein
VEAVLMADMWRRQHSSCCSSSVSVGIWGVILSSELTRNLGVIETRDWEDANLLGVCCSEVSIENRVCGCLHT